MSESIRKPSFEAVMIYVLLMEKVSIYGYQLVAPTHIEEGTIYSTLRRLRKKQFVSMHSRPSHDGPDQKIYVLTEKGRLFLRQSLDTALMANMLTDKPEFDLELEMFRRRVEKLTAS